MRVRFVGSRSSLVRSLVGLGVLGALLGTTGCGPALYTLETTSASHAVAEAEAAGARTWAPYEYWFARENLVKAREEAAEASYEDAIRFAQTAADYAEQARRRATSGSHGAAQASPSEASTATGPGASAP